MNLQDFLDNPVFDKTHVLMLLCDIQMQFAAELSKDSPIRDREWAKFYALREMRDKQKIADGNFIGMKLSGSEAARKWREELQ